MNNTTMAFYTKIDNHKTPSDSPNMVTLVYTLIITYNLI